MWQSTHEFSNRRRKWICRNCGNEQYEFPPQGLKIPPKILYIDIESALMSVDLYDLYIPGKRINKDMIDRHRFVINWAAVWVTPKEYTIKGRIMTGVVTQREAKRQNDKRILKPIFDLLEQADYICGHNSDGFDVKILKWRFLYHGMGYPLASKSADTFKLSGKGRPESRALEYLSLAFGGKPKKGLTQDEWREIAHQGTPRLLAKSNRYCRGDVREGVNVLRRYVLAEERSGKVIFK